MKRSSFFRWLGESWRENLFGGRRQYSRRRNRAGLGVEVLESRTLLTVSPNLIANGDFEIRDLAGEQGNLDGWAPFNLALSPGSAGAWAGQTGTTSPLSFATVPGPSSGLFEAMLDEQDQVPIFQGSNINTAASYAGSHALYQDITIPNNVTSLTLSFHLYIDNTNSASGYSDPNTTSTLNWNIAQANQQVRVDLLSPSGNILDVVNASSGGTVLQNLFQTTPAQTPTQSLNLSFTLNTAAYAGQTIRFRVAAVNNQGKLLVGVDNVQLTATFADTTAPTLTGLQLRNPNFVPGKNNTPQSTDPTIIGRVGDNGSVNNVSFVEFDVKGDGFGGPDDITVTNFDANGNFSVTIPGLAPGVYTMPVEAVDNAGNTTAQNFTFMVQGPSLTNWQAIGPGPIDISSAGFDYKKVTGDVTSVVVDATDRSGNTIYLGSDNGGVWRSTDGGNDWVALTDNVFDASGQRVPEAIGALAIGPISQGVSTVPVLYAGTGVANTFTAPVGGDGILKSVNGGAFTLVGQSTFKGAHISKIVVDPTNANTVYVAVSWWDANSKSPGVFWSNDGGATWKDILIPTDMFPSGLGNPTLATGTQLASVTDLVIDPFNPARLIVGLGNIGEVAGGPSTTGGVWLRLPDNPGVFRWVLQKGGDSAIVPNNRLPFGEALGRVSVAIGSGISSDEATVYVLITNPPPTTQFRGIFDGGQFSGLYKTKDNFLNFTKVRLKEFVGYASSNPLQPIYQDIALSGRNAINSGSVLVDPTNPNVVYVGGSDAYLQPGDNAPVVGKHQYHSLIRVDTGDMRDTTYQDPDASFAIPNDGDDIQKAEKAEDNWIAQTMTFPDPKFLGNYGNKAVYNDYTKAFQGEGVYWYDLVQAGVNTTGSNSFLPTTINSIALDPQGRLLFGTINGIWRGLPLGFGYDFSTGNQGLHVLFTETQPNAPGMTITSLNGNLQITDLTSVAVDPSTPNTFYTTQFYSGTARTTLGSPGSWMVMDLTGPIDPLFGNLGVTNAVEIRAAAPFPTDKPGTLTTLFRSWQFLNPNALELDVSADSGQSFTQTIKAGISSNDLAGLNIPFALSPNAVVVNGLDFHQLLFGTDRVYITDTSTDVWDPISPILSSTGFVSALAFAPSAAGVYYAGTTDGQIFVETPNAAWLNRSTGLPSGSRVNGITVDSTNANVAYAMLTTPTGGGVWKTTNGGVQWTQLPGLPNVPAYALAIDPRTTPVFSQGFLYVGTQVGVAQSTDLGNTWSALSQGLPAAPVVDLQLNPNLNELAAAVQGRGVFEVSTDRFGPRVVSVTPTTPVSSFNSITVTFDRSVDPASFTSADIDVFTSPTGASITPTSIVDVTNPPMGQPNLHNVYQINFPTQTANGLYTLTIGPNITNVVGVPMDQDNDGINGSIPDDEFTTQFVINSSDNGLFVSGLYHDLLGRSADTQGFLTELNIIDTLRFALLPAFANGFLTSKEYFTDQVNAYYQKYLGRPADAGGLASNVNALLAGQTTDEQVIANLVGSAEYFSNHGSTNLSFLQAAYPDILNRPLDSSGQSTFMAQLQNGVSRTTVALELLTSTEYRTNLVSGYYSTFLGRTGSSGEVGGWVNALANGVKDEQVIDAFVGSVEYFQGATLGGNTNVNWFTSLYQKLLNRAPDSGGLNSNVDGLLADYAAQRQTDIFNIMNSTEFLTNKVNGFYQKFLGRPADSGALTADIAALRSGQTTDELLIANLVGSAEYFAKHGSTNQSFLQAAYPDILGRSLDSSGQSTFMAQLQNGVSRTTVAMELLTSNEYRTNLVGGFYTTYLGRTGSSGEIAGWVNVLANGVTDETVTTDFLLTDEYFLRTHPYP
jgi:hypothetical protein